MKIGMLTGIWNVARGATLFESLERVAALGFRHVDLQGVLHAGPKHLTSRERQEVKTVMKSLGLVPRNYILFPLHNQPSATNKELESSYQYLCEGIDLAVSWNINQLMFNAGMWAFGVGREVAWSRAVRFFQRICDYAAPRDVFIAQEAEPYVWCLVNDIASSAKMMQDVDRPNFTTLIDLGHMALAREGGDELSSLVESVIHVHLSDHEPLRHTNQIIGTGFLPIADYLEALRALEIDRRVKRFGYDEAVVTLELGYLGDRIDDPDEWVRRSVQHVREAAPYMQLS
jgi:sugar phosphate isomerase/epimerase